MAQSDMAQENVMPGSWPERSEDVEADGLWAFDTPQVDTAQFDTAQSNVAQENAMPCSWPEQPKDYETETTSLSMVLPFALDLFRRIALIIRQKSDKMPAKNISQSDKTPTEHIPLEVVERVALALHDEGDFTTLLSLQRVSHDYWRVTTPVIWRNLILEESRQLDAFLRPIHSAVHERTPNWNPKYRILDLISRMTGYASSRMVPDREELFELPMGSKALKDGMSRFDFGCRAVRSLTIGPMIISQRRLDDKTIYALVKRHHRRRDSSPLFPKLARINLGDRIERWRDNVEIISCILGYRTPALCSISVMGGTLDQSAIPGFLRLVQSTAPKLCSHERSASFAVGYILCGWTHVYHLPHDYSSTRRVRLPSFALLGLDDPLRVPSTVFDFRGTSSSDEGQEQERKEVAEALEEMLWRIRSLLNDPETQSAVAPLLLKRLVEPGAWTYTPRQKSEELCSVCGKLMEYPIEIVRERCVWGDNLSWLDDRSWLKATGRA